MDSNIAIDAIERQKWLEPVADQLQTAVHRAFESAGPGGQKVKNALHGTWLGHAVHPVLTDVPLGAWTAALVLDLLEANGGAKYGPGADAAVAVGLAGAAGAAVTGLTDWSDTDGEARRVGLAHGLMNMAGTLLYTTSYIMRRRKARAAGRAFGMAGFAVAMAAAYLGGHLVYGQQIGVDHTVGEEPPKRYVPVLADSDLAEGELRRVEVKGMRILLARFNGKVYALAETCSHLGGPLAEGKLEEDCSVRCPWHGSRFSLEDGRVLDGPATHPQMKLAVRVADGQIKVRG